MQRSCFFLTVLAIKRTLLTVVILAVVGCAAVPVQEMSDARQALRSAELAGAAQRSPETFALSKRLLQDAQTYLEAGAYHDARRVALKARDQAIQAREKAIPHPSVPLSLP